MKSTCEKQGTSEQVVKDIRRTTRKHHAAVEKIRIVLDGLRGEYSIAEVRRREGIADRTSWCKFYWRYYPRRGLHKAPSIF